MRKIYCFACARECEYTRAGMNCYGTDMARIADSRLANAIIDACDRARKPITGPLAPGIGDELRCPNCTQPLDETTWDDRFMRCSSCRFELSVLHVPDLYFVLREHDPKEDDWG